MRRLMSGVFLSLMLLMTGILLAQESDPQAIVDSYTEGRAYAYLSLIYPGNRSYKLHLVFPDTEIVLPLEDELYTSHYDISPDGTRVAYTVRSISEEGLPVEHSPEIYDLRSGTIIQTGTPDWFHSLVKWSPDGSEIAFFQYYEFFLYDVADETIRSVTIHYPPYFADFSPGILEIETRNDPYNAITWRPDNTMIASIGASGYGGIWDLQSQYIVDTETRDFESYDVPGGTHLPPEYSPDSNYLAILSSVDGQLLGTIVTVETGETQEVITDSFEIPWDLEILPFENRRISPPVWSPDSSAFAFVASWDVYIVNRIDGTTRKIPVGTVDAVAGWLTPELLLTADYIDAYHFRMVDYDIMTLDGTRIRSGENWSWEVGYQQISWFPEIISPVMPLLPTPTPAPVHCEDSLGSRVSVGDAAFVVISPEGETRSDLRVRDEPAGDQIASMAEGTQFTIMEGPVCADGLTWWRLETLDGEISGWSAESIAPDTYLIQPES